MPRGKGISHGLRAVIVKTHQSSQAKQLWMFPGVNVLPNLLQSPNVSTPKAESKTIQASLSILSVHDRIITRPQQVYLEWLHGETFLKMAWRHDWGEQSSEPTPQKTFGSMSYGQMRSTSSLALTHLSAFQQKHLLFLSSTLVAGQWPGRLARTEPTTSSSVFKILL